MTAQSPAVAQRRARRVLLLIAGIPLSMMLAATALWWAVQNGYVDILGSVGTANHGELINPPRSLTDVVFQHEGVADTLWEDLPAKWRLLVVQRGDVCGDTCQQQLYQTRQIHLALGKDFNRVGRVVLGHVATASVMAPADLENGEASLALLDWLGKEHVGVTPLTLPASQLNALVPESVDQPEHWYVVDPAGWIMMRISDDLYYKDVISDLRFLLKHSGG
jgi:hypothetical protein